MITFLKVCFGFSLDISRWFVIWLNYEYMFRDMFKSLPEIGFLKMVWLLLFFSVATMNIAKKDMIDEFPQVVANCLVQVVILLSMLGLYRFFS